MQVPRTLQSTNQLDQITIGQFFVKFCTPMIKLLTQRFATTVGQSQALWAMKKPLVKRFKTLVGLAKIGEKLFLDGNAENLLVCCGVCAGTCRHLLLFFRCYFLTGFFVVLILWVRCLGFHCKVTHLGEILITRKSHLVAKLIMLRLLVAVYV